MDSTSGRVDELVEERNAALERLEQFMWEAPKLRPIKIPFYERMELANPCPSWCVGTNIGHDPSEATEHPQEHESAPLNVRQDVLFPFIPNDDVEWLEYSHLSLTLTLGSRGAMPRIRIRQYSSDRRTGGCKSRSLGTLFFDEARELVAVLQHLMKVGADS